MRIAGFRRKYSSLECWELGVRCYDFGLYLEASKWFAKGGHTRQAVNMIEVQSMLVMTQERSRRRGIICEIVKFILGK